MNPELRRNLWLDVTPRRLVLAGAILAGAFVAVWLVDRGRHAFALTAAGAAVFGLSALVWAPRKARRAVTDEARAATWDFQRLGALDPLALAWGKLAGATARPWAFAVVGLLIAFLQLASTTNLRHALSWVATALGLAVTLQCAGLASGLLDVRRARASGRGLAPRAPGLAFAILALLALAAVVWIETRVAHEANRLSVFGLRLAVREPVVNWAGRAIPALRFAAFSLAALAALSAMLAWRLTCLELRYSPRPWVWPAALGLICLYVFGFDPLMDASSPLAARLGAGTLAAGGLAWVCAFAEPADRVMARRLGRALTAGAPAALLREAPAFAWAAAAAGAFAALVAGIHLANGDGPQAVLAIAAIAWLFRDLGIIARRRFCGAGDLGAAAPLALLYVVAVALSLLTPQSRILALMVPSLAHPRAGLVALGLEAAIAWLFAAAAVVRPIAAPFRPWDDQDPEMDETPPATTAVPTTSEGAP